MLNKKGKALVEFILILPIFLMILFVIVDFGMIFSSKSSLENTSNDIVLMIQNGDNVNDISSNYSDIVVDIKKSNDGEYYVVLIEKKLDLVTPGINIILDNPYVVSVKRVVPYEDS